MRLALASLLLCLCHVDGCAAGPPPPPAPVVPLVIGKSRPPPLQQLPAITTDNHNTLLVASSVVATASSTFPGWPTSNATDGKPETSWYSGNDDSAAKGGAPFLQIELPEASPVRRVTVLGNRDPQFLVGYTILSGRIDLLDEAGRVLESIVSDGTGNQRDFDVQWRHAIKGVKTVRFTSLADEGDKNTYGDVAIAEMQIE